jgi:hypothetical protein
VQARQGAGAAQKAAIKSKTGKIFRMGYYQTLEGGIDMTQIIIAGHNGLMPSGGTSPP